MSDGRRILLLLCSLATLAVGGCADMPTWVPFQGPASDQLPGVLTPAERIDQLRTLSAKAPSSNAAEREQISHNLVEAIRTEKDPLIRVEIIRALGRYPGPSADAVLKAAASDVDTHVRLAACEAWGKRGGADAVALLGETMRSDVEADVRLAAAKALGETGDRTAVAVLGEVLNDADPAMQYRAVLSLERITGKDLGNNVDRWQQYVKGGLPQSTPSLAERPGQRF